jgi:hypothetical protein
VTQEQEVNVTNTEIMTWEPDGGSAITPANLVAQMRLVDHIKKAVMVENVHYGKIPGCGPKPTLFKPGAEKLLFVFRMRVIPEEDDIRVEDHGDGHRTYTVIVPVYNDQGEKIGSGVGVCSTLETKYRFRNENTGAPVPQKYWTARDQDLLGGPTFFPRKVSSDGGKQAWVIFQQVEHPNPADYWNTCAKMGKKRALVDAALTTTASSDQFTQDVEENPALYGGAEGIVPVTKTTAPPAQPQPVGGQQPPPAAAPPAAAQPAAPPAAARQTPDPAVTAPAQAAPPPTVGENIITGVVSVISSSSGTKVNGEAWTRSGVKIGDEWYNTFSETFAAIAARSRDHGVAVEVEFSVNNYGRQIENMSLQEGAPVAAGVTVNPYDRADSPIPSAFADDPGRQPGDDDGFPDDGDVPF